MTERQMREPLIEQSNQWGYCLFCNAVSTYGPCELEHEAKCPLATEPDVVKILRAIKALQRSDGCICPLTLGYLMEEVERAFGVHLIDDGGWEWVLGEEKAE